MNPNNKTMAFDLGPRLAHWPLPGKVLITMIILMTAIGFAGALGQIIVHDIIPTFWGEKKSVVPMAGEIYKNKFTRGDIFATMPSKKKAQPFYKTDEFIFALKFTHIHIFGMSAIFVLMGIIVLFLDLGEKSQVLLISLPFIGIIIDLASVWFKIFIHPVFFWLHIPGGMLFGAIFAIDAILILWQMWRYGFISKR
jgi:hypothetical protein